jgi:hypothetical protein
MSNGWLQTSITSVIVLALINFENADEKCLAKSSTEVQRAQAGN